jgi:hypothetical protein
MKLTSPEWSLAMARASVELHHQRVMVQAWRERPAADPAVDRTTLRLLRLVLEAMFGDKVEVAILAQGRRLADEPVSCEWKASIAEQAVHMAAEHLSFAARGAFRADDGRDVGFDFSLQLDRQYVQETNQSVVTHGTRGRPLVLSLDAASVRISADRIEFELDSDGNDEVMPYVRAGSGSLLFDRGAKDRIDDGHEPSAWVDEADSGFDLLQAWTESSTPEARRALEEVDVGALSVGALETCSRWG